MYYFKVYYSNKESQNNEVSFEIESFQINFVAVAGPSFTIISFDNNSIPLIENIAFNNTSIDKLQILEDNVVKYETTNFNILDTIGVNFSNNIFNITITFIKNMALES